jgi:hypothetical protein
MTRDTATKVAWLRNSTDHRLGNSAVVSVCVCVCARARAVCSRLCCRAQPFIPDRLLLLPSIEVSTASFGTIPAQIAILGAMTSESMCTHTGLTIQAPADIPHTSQETERSERSPGAGTHHKVDYILIAFVSPLSVWLQRPASIRCWASGKSLYRAVPVGEGREPPQDGQTDNTAASLHTKGQFLGASQ